MKKVTRKGDLGCFRLYTLEVPQPCSLNPWRKANATDNSIAENTQTLNVGTELAIQAKIASAAAIKELSVSPNPVREQITIATVGWDGETTARVTNVEGKLMKQLQLFGNSRMVLDINDLVQGVYFLQINNGKAITTEKFIVK